MLTDWWKRLEAAPRFGGPRRYVHDLLGTEVARFLERAGVLRQGGIAPSFPCQERRGDQCPRTVIKIGDDYHAVCGNGPIGCRDLILTEYEAALLTADMLGLCRITASALGIRSSSESIHDLNCVHRVGIIMPEPNIRYPAYLVIRSNAQSYAEVLGALVARHAGGPFSMLVPTSRFLTDGMERQAQTRGVSIIALAEVMVLAGDVLSCDADPATVFAPVGHRTPTSFDTADEIVARALVRDGISKHRWQDLDERGYQALSASACNYDIFADEKTRTVRKGHSIRGNIPQSNFRSVEAAVKSRGYFDPNVTGPDLTSGKQLFQRTRQSFDIRSGGSSWKIFKTVRTEEGHAVYAFQPDSDVSFVFIFLARS